MMIVLTKCDMCQGSWELHRAVENVLGEYASTLSSYTIHPYVHAVSALNQDGLQELQVALGGIAQDGEYEANNFRNSRIRE